MKLLFYGNLSHRLVPALQAAFAGTRYVQELGLQGASDSALRAFAGREGYAPASKDDDFRQLSLLHGPPPKVLVLAIGNGDNAVALRTLLRDQARIEAFDAGPLESLLVLRAVRG